MVERWRHSKEVIEEELDERSELASAKALGRVALATVPLTVFALVALVVLPLSGGQRESGLQLLIPAIIAVAAITLSITSHRSRAFSPRLRRAVLIRSAWAYPVGAVVVGLVEFAWHGDAGDAVGFVVASMVGMLGGTVLHLWWLSSRREEDRP